MTHLGWVLAPWILRRSDPTLGPGRLAEPKAPPLNGEPRAGEPKEYLR